MPGRLIVTQRRPIVRIKFTGRVQTDWDALEGDFLSVQIQRGVNQAAGTWAITLVPRRQQSQNWTWAQRVRPMDYCEIRISEAGTSPNQQPPIVMRGFVDAVSESFNAQGQGPQRTVTIIGKDYGKLLLTKQIFMFQYLDPVLNALTLNGEDLFRQAYQDIFLKELTPQAFLDSMKTLVIDNSVDASFPTGLGPLTQATYVTDIPKLTVKAQNLDQFRLNIQAAPSIVGPVWNLLAHFQSQPWGEFVLRELDDGPQFLWRWTPYKNQKGELIAPATDPGSITVPASSLISYQLTTSDQDVHNYYFSQPEGGPLLGPNPASSIVISDTQAVPGTDPNSQAFQAGASGKNPTVRVDLVQRYGVRPLNVASPLFPVQDFPTQDTFNAQTNQWRDLAEFMTTWLDKSFSHSALLEEGTLVVKGNANFLPGTYVTIKETGQEFYIETVMHAAQINPPSFTTTLQVKRGLWPQNRSPYPPETTDESPGVIITVPTPPVPMPEISTADQGPDPTLPDTEKIIPDTGLGDPTTASVQFIAPATGAYRSPSGSI